MVARWMVVVMMGVVLAGCFGGQGGGVEKREAGKMAAVSGEGKILAVDQTLGQGTMEVEGKKVVFWWQNRIQMAGRSEGPNDAPEMQMVAVPFNAQIGDWVIFKGFDTGGEIFVTAARVVKK